MKDGFQIRNPKSRYGFDSAENLIHDKVRLTVSPSGIVTIADVSALRVRVDSDETDVAKIRENQTAFVTADAFGERRFAARVVKINRILGRKNFRTERPTEKVDTKILEVMLELAPHYELPLGLRVDAFIAAE